MKLKTKDLNKVFYLGNKNDSKEMTNRFAENFDLPDRILVQLNRHHGKWLWKIG